MARKGKVVEIGEHTVNELVIRAEDGEPVAGADAMIVQHGGGAGHAVEKFRPGEGALAIDYCRARAIEPARAVHGRDQCQHVVTRAGSSHLAGMLTRHGRDATGSESGE